MSRVECFPAYVVMSREGVVVLLAESPHLAGEQLVWDDSREVFRSRAHGETFDMTGTLISGPAYRDMWQCPTAIEGGHVMVGGHQMQLPQIWSRLARRKTCAEPLASDAPSGRRGWLRMGLGPETPSL